MRDHINECLACVRVHCVRQRRRLTATTTRPIYAGVHFVGDANAALRIIKSDNACAHCGAAAARVKGRSIDHVPAVVVVCACTWSWSHLDYINGHGDMRETSAHNPVQSASATSTAAAQVERVTLISIIALHSADADRGCTLLAHSNTAAIADHCDSGSVH